VEDRVAYCQDIEARIVVAREQAELYNAREELFQQKPTEYPQVRCQRGPYSDATSCES
jgi:hypothetical protein